MSKICQICAKSPIVGVTRRLLRGKYNPTAKKKKYPNLQWVRLANGKRVRACAKCIKMLLKSK